MASQEGIYLYGISYTEERKANGTTRHLSSLASVCIRNFMNNRISIICSKKNVK
jgi:hypothetical protein